MRALVTGAAGFIGSHLSQALLSAGHEVCGVDLITDYYAVERKFANLDLVRDNSDRFSFHEVDLAACDAARLLDGVDVVFHQAGQPGVRASWAEQFDAYVSRNIVATQRLLDASKGHPSLRRFVFASSSSVYGEAIRYPTTEADLPRPHSPYGVTKLAAEHLCGLYASNWDVPTVALRYFTVFGSRQRPDMAMHRLVEAGLSGGQFPMFGDGSQVRDFTHVSDIVAANLAAAESDLPGGAVINIAGGSSASLAEVIATVEKLVGREIALDRRSGQAGDVKRTGADTSLARDVLGWEPRTTLEEGLQEQIEWHREARRDATGG